MENSKNHILMKRSPAYVQRELHKCLRAAGIDAKQLGSDCSPDDEDMQTYGGVLVSPEVGAAWNLAIDEAAAKKKSVPVADLVAAVAQRLSATAT